MFLTLHKYIARDLLKKGSLALLVFTLIMTTFGVIEPMRNFGLSPGQVFKLFWYLLPVMLSLTLPIAALLATTMTYGRLAMDNEFTACLASGVSASTIIRPALVTGALVTLMTLLLSNWVAPALAMEGQRMSENNLRGLVYQMLRTSQVMPWGNDWLIHADSANSDTDELDGVVAIRRHADQTQYYVASRAMVQFMPGLEGSDVWVALINPAAGRLDRFDVTTAERMTLGPYPIPSPIREHPSLYTWSDLVAVWRDPQASAAVQLAMEDIRQQLMASARLARISKSIPGGFELLDKDSRRCRFLGSSGTCSGSSLCLPGSGGEDKSPVTVEIYGAGSRPEVTLKAAKAQLEAEYIPPLGRPQVTATLTDVESLTWRGDAQEKTVMPEYVVGPLELPGNEQEEAAATDLRHLVAHPEQYPSMTKKINALKRTAMQLSLQVLGEMHARISYGLGCMMLVASGAALGLLFKGGNVLSAFALSCLPALILIATMFMGKHLIRNGSIPIAYGVAGIWSGVALRGRADVLSARSGPPQTHMIGTLDRYVIRSFLHSYVLCLAIMIGLRLGGDLFVNIDDFAQANKQSDAAQMVTHIATYYGVHSLRYFQELSGVILAAAAAFTLARMNHTNELTAVLASGTSIYRVILPVVIVSLCLSALSVVDQELIIPQFKDRLSLRRVESLETFKMRVRLLQDARGRVWYSDNYQARYQRMTQPIILARDKRAMLLARLSGSTATYHGDGYWRVEDGVVVRPGDEHETMTAEFVPTPATAAILAATSNGGAAVVGDLALDANFTSRADGVMLSVKVRLYCPETMRRSSLDARPPGREDDLLTTAVAQMAVQGRRGNEMGFYLVGEPEVTPAQLTNVPELCKRLVSESAAAASLSGRLWQAIGNEGQELVGRLANLVPAKVTEADKESLAAAFSAAITRIQLAAPADIPGTLLTERSWRAGHGHNHAPQPAGRGSSLHRPALSQPGGHVGLKRHDAAGDGRPPAFRLGGLDVHQRDQFAIRHG